LGTVHPQRVIKVVRTGIVGIGMQQYGEAEAIELHPGHDDWQQIVRKTKVERRRCVRPAWLRIPVAEFDRKSLAGPPANERCPFERILIEIKMGVITLNVGKRAGLRR